MKKKRVYSVMILFLWSVMAVGSCFPSKKKNKIHPVFREVKEEEVLDVRDSKAFVGINIGNILRMSDRELGERVKVWHKALYQDLQGPRLLELERKIWALQERRSSFAGEYQQKYQELLQKLQSQLDLVIHQNSIALQRRYAVYTAFNRNIMRVLEKLSEQLASTRQENEEEALLAKMGHLNFIHQMYKELAAGIVARPPDEVVYELIPSMPPSL